MPAAAQLALQPQFMGRGGPDGGDSGTVWPALGAVVATPTSAAPAAGPGAAALPDSRAGAALPAPSMARVRDRPGARPPLLPAALLAAGSGDGEVGVRQQR